MPDIALRFHKEMLVLSAPIDPVLESQGVDVEKDREFLSVVEPETIQDIYQLEMVAGTQCVVTNTAGITNARLAHVNMEGRGLELATAALTIANSLKPQHVFAEIGPTRLPLDISSKSSLRQNKQQYERAATDFGAQGFDAFFLNGMNDIYDMQCALMGIRTKSDKPIIASLEVDAEGAIGGRKAQDLESSLKLMEEYEASVVGFSCAASLDCVVSLAKRAACVVDAPLLVQLQVKKCNPKQLSATEDNPYYTPDTMIEAATALRAAGVQFLRATGKATPAYTGALVAASLGFDSLR